MSGPRLTLVADNSQPLEIMWFDPGLTTGWASFMHDHSFTSGQGPFHDVGDRLTRSAEIYGPTLWVGWELYNVTSGGGKAGTPKYSLETIGMLKWICHEHDVTLLKPVPSSNRKLGDDLKLKRLGWRVPGQRHANDAANHTLAHLIRTKTLPAELLALITSD